MKLVIKLSHIAAAIIVGSVIGYPVASVLSILADVESQPVVIVMRALIAASAVFLLLGRKHVHSRLAVAMFTIFWSAYLLRLGYTFGLANESASQPASTFFVWSLGVCLLPSLAILLYRGTINFAKFGPALALWGSFAMIGILLLGGTAIETDQGLVADQNRWNLSTINPITIGHIGASLVIVASAAILYGKASARRSLLYGSVAMVGLIGLFLANSRGPIVALMIAIGLYGLAQIRSRRTWSYTILAMLAGAFAVNRYADAIFSERGLLDRFVSVFTGQDRSTTARNDLYIDGFNQFLSSPFIGDGVEVRSQAYYPHNVMLEAFMTTGLLGGAAFLFLTLLALRAAFRIMKHEPQKAVLALLAVQYIVAAQLSGAIYQSGAMWVMMAGVLTFSTVSKPVQTRKSKRPRVLWQSVSHRPGVASTSLPAGPSR